MKPKYRHIALLLGVTVATAAADTYKISLDFNQANADGTGTGLTTTGVMGAMPGQTVTDVWNNIPVGNAWVGFHPTNPGLANGGASGGVATNTKVLNRTTGSPSPISLAVSTSNASGQRFQAGNNAFNADDALTLMRDYLFQNSGTITLTLSGLVSSESYTLYLYGAGDNTGQGGTWSVLPATGATFVGGDNTTAAESANPNLTAGEDYIVVTFDGSSPTRAFTITNSGTRSVNGFQLDAINAPTFSNLAITGGASQNVDVPFVITVTAQDINSNLVNDSTTPVTLSSPTPGSLLEFDWNMDGTYGDNSGTLVNGVKMVQVRTKKAQVGANIVGAAGSATNLPLFTFDVTAGAYAKLQVLAPGETAVPGTTGTGKTGIPIIQTLGSLFNVTVNKVDEFWNPLDATGTFILFNATPSGGASVPSGAEDLGFSATHEVTPTSVGSFTVTVTDDADGTKNGTSSSITALGTSTTWVGDQSAQWDTTTLNWTNGSPVAFADTNRVTFNDTGSANPVINLAQTVTPSLISVNNSTVDYTFGGSGSIAGVFGGFTKAGTGSLTVSTANSYTGTTTVSGGILILDNASALPNASPLALTGGLLGLKNGNFTRALGTGANQVTLTSGSGFAAFGADRAVNFGGASAPISWDVDLLPGGTVLNLSATSATHTLDVQNPITLSSGLNFFTVADGAAAVDAIISGPITAGGVGFSKVGNGTLMLSNTGNAYTGFGTFIDSGTLILGASEVLPNSLGITIKRANGSGNTDAILDINGFNETVGGILLGESGTNSGNVGQQPSVINSGASTAVLTSSGGITYAAGSVGFLNGQATISANLNTGTGTNTINVGDGTAPVDLLISGSLTGAAINKTGLGALTVSSPNYTGNTTVTAGSLSFGAANPNNNASTVTIVAGGVLNLNYAGTDVVISLVINGVAQPDGVYGAAQHPGVITGTGTITVGTAPVDPFVTWAGAGVNFDDDANNDGVDNGLAWLLGALNPSVNANALLPVVTQTGGSLKLTFDMLPASARDGAQLFIEHSSNLGISDPWTSVLVPDASGGTAPVTFVVGGASPLDVEATISSSEAAAGKLFGRVRAER